MTPTIVLASKLLSCCPMQVRQFWIVCESSSCKLWIDRCSMSEDVSALTCSISTLK